MAGGARFRVVIAGGGVAGLESALALLELAGDRVGLALVAPGAEFVYRPQSVGEPFAYAPARRYPLAQFAAEVGAELIAERFGWVDPGERVAHTGTGAALAYDALVLALGARMRAELTPTPYAPEIHGVLETGAEPLFLTARLAGTHDMHGLVSGEAGPSPSSKIAARYLTSYLERRDRESQR